MVSRAKAGLLWHSAWICFAMQVFMLRRVRRSKAALVRSTEAPIASSSLMARALRCDGLLLSSFLGLLSSLPLGPALGLGCLVGKALFVLLSLFGRDLVWLFLFLFFLFRGFVQFRKLLFKYCGAGTASAVPAPS